MERPQSISPRGLEFLTERVPEGGHRRRRGAARLAAIGRVGCRVSRCGLCSEFWWGVAVMGMDVKRPRGAPPQAKGGVQSCGQGERTLTDPARGGIRPPAARVEERRGDARPGVPSVERIRHPFDPDGSRMLVSETKPCKSKYTSVNDGNCERLIKSVAIYSAFRAAG